MNNDLRPSEGGRIKYIDALRGFAILLVIEGHVRLFGMGIDSYDTMSALMLYSLDLPLFFFISGLLGFRPDLSVKETIIYTIIITLTCLCFIYVLEQSKFVKTYILGLK